MKKYYVFLLLFVLMIMGCDNGTSSKSGGGGNQPLGFLNGDWSGQWSGQINVTQNENGSTGVIPVGGRLRASLTQNNRQLSGTVWSDDSSGYFEATLSNPNGSGNIESGVTQIKILGELFTISFHGTYDNFRIYALMGPSSTGSSGRVIEGNFILTK
jgi:hypothetical protein